MEGVLVNIYNYCWDSYIWFPEGMSWKDFESNDPNVYYGKPKDIHWCFVVGILFLVVRYVYEKVIIRPFGRYLGIKERKRRATPNDVFESTYTKFKGKVPDAEIKKLSKQSDMRELDVQKWMSARKNQNNSTNIDKFSECCWHLVLYTSLFIYGLVVLWDKPWLWESKYFWVDWPQPVTNDIYWYYLIEMGGYWSFIFTLFIDTKRKDFYEMIIHHFATLLLMYLSWCASFSRVGSYILVIHDIADIWLAMAKISNYAKYKTVCEVSFAVFAVVWICTRIGIYPYVPVYSVIVEIHTYIKPFPMHKMFMFLLCLLQVLHIMWTVFLFKMINKKLRTGGMQKDARSDSEDVDSSEQELNSHPVNNENKDDAQIRKSKRLAGKTS